MLKRTLFLRLRITLRKNKPLIVASCVSFLAGRFINSISGKDKVKSFVGLWNELFNLHESLWNIFSWICVIVLLGILVLIKILNNYYKTKNDFALTNKLRNLYIDPGIAHLAQGKIAWGKCITIQQAPDLSEGWNTKQIKIFKNSSFFELPDKYKNAYKAYFKANKATKRFFDDGTKFMLSKNPISSTDSPTLILEFDKCLYSEIQFFKDEVLLSSTEKNRLLKSIEEDPLTIKFPHSMCLHLTIITKDNKILLTKRSNKVAYYPNTWSVSIEEQLAKDDFKNENDKVLDNLLDRSLKEELGFSTDFYDIKNFRILSVFLESDILNCSLCGVLNINISAEEVNQILSVKPRNDHEFTKWNFINWDNLKQELKLTKRNLHPSSSYRMLLCLINKFGTEGLTEMA